MTFSPLDYAVFICFNCLNVFTGVYFGWYKKNKSSADYLVGARQMKALPIGISSLLSMVSSITVMGLPTEIYFHGVQLLYICFGYILSSLLVAFFYVPVFYKIKVTSSFEYFERRFDKRLRIIASGICILQLMSFLPIAVLTSAIAINYMTHIDIHLITPVFCIIGIFYTSMGGFRAVVWSDFLQAFILFPSIYLIGAKGTYDIGLKKIIEQGLASKRLEPPIFDLTPNIRYSFWSLFIGGGVYYSYTGFLQQLVMQKYQSLPTLKDVRISMLVNLLGLIVLILGCGYNGLIMYSYYYDCDPITNQTIKIHDQLLPSVAESLFRNLPGLCGVFITGISSAALSSLASGINSLSAMILEDFYKSVCKKEISEEQSVKLLRVISFIIGTFIFSLVFLVEHLGSVFELSYSFDVLFAGILLSLLTTGIFLPWINAKAISIGSLVGLCSVGWICVNAMLQKLDATKFNTKPLSVEKCASNISIAEDKFMNLSDDTPFFLYQISYFWYALIGCSITIFVSIIVSFCIGWNNLSEIDCQLISPYLHRFLPQAQRNRLSKENINKNNIEIDLLLKDANNVKMLSNS